MTSHNPRLGADAYPDEISIDDSPAGQYIQTLVIDGLGGHTDEWLLFVAAGDNIYSVDGALVADRTVDGNTNDLTFTDIGAFNVSAVGINLQGPIVVNESGASIDQRIEGDTDANLVFIDGSTDRVGIGTAAPAAKLDVVGTVLVTGATTLDGAVVVNEGGAAAGDLRVEGDTDANLFFTDASTDRVGIGTNAPTVKLDVVGATLITGATTIEGAVVINDTSADVDVRIESNGDANNFVSDGGLDAIGIGVLAPVGKLDVTQPAAAGAKPVINVHQVDTSEEFIRFRGTSAADNTMSIVDAADLAVPGAIVGWLRIYVQDDAGAGAVADGIYFVPFYTTPTA